MKTTDIMEALGEVPEDLVIRALSAADDRMAAPAEREQIMMITEHEEKRSSRRIWLRGGIAAAIAGVLLAGNLALLYSLGKIGRNGSSVAETTVSTPAEITETTEQTTETATETTETTTTTADPNKVIVPNFYGMDYDKAVKLAESCGLILSVSESSGWQPPGDIGDQSVSSDEAVDKGTHILVNLDIPRFEFDKDGKPVRIDFTYKRKPFDPADIPVHILTDGQYQFQTRGNSLYRTDNDQLIMTIEDPQQYLDAEIKDFQTAVEFDSIQAVGTDWYLISASIYYYPDEWHFWKCVSFWNNRKTGKSEPAVYTLKRSDLNIKPEWDDAYGGDFFGYEGDSVTEFVSVFQDHIAAAPDGSGVYIGNHTFILHVPTPGNGKLRVYETGTNIPYYKIDQVLPLENRKILFNVYYSSEDGTDPWPDSGLFELDPANGNIRTIGKNFEVKMYRINQKIICLIHDAPNHNKPNQRIAEYLPESRSFRTIADLKDITWDLELTETGISNDALILSPQDWDDNIPDLLVSLKDGKVTELK